jgi:predicted nucleic acid-binding protein
MTVGAGANKVLVDTNVIVYMHDVREPEKRARAGVVVGGLLKSGRMVLTAQVLNETYAAMVRLAKASGSVAGTEAAAVVRDFAATCEVLPLTAITSVAALEGVASHGLSFWDSLIWASARERGIGIVCSEDFQHGREIAGVRFVSPFAPDADQLIGQ